MLCRVRICCRVSAPRATSEASGVRNCAPGEDQGAESGVRCAHVRAGLVKPASCRRSVRSPSTAPSARRDRVGASPRFHGSGCIARRAARPAGVAKSRIAEKICVRRGRRSQIGMRRQSAGSQPLSPTTRSGYRASIAVAIYARRSERVPVHSGARTYREDVLAGKTSAQHGHPRRACRHSTLVISPRFEMPGR